jgi:hypothetical protein
LATTGISYNLSTGIGCHSCGKIDGKNQQL